MFYWITYKEEDYFIYYTTYYIQKNITLKGEDFDELYR